MTTERIFKVMVYWFLLLPLTAAALCRPGHQYWSESLEKCVNCSKCPEVGHVVLRPCQVHQDTECGPLSALDIDWSFLSSRSHHAAFDERTKSRKSHHKKWSSSSEESSSFEKSPKKHHKHRRYHKKHSSSETHSGGHKKHRQGHHNNNTRGNQKHEKLEWSSEIIRSLAFPDALNSSESHRQMRHQWSSSETSGWSNSTRRKHDSQKLPNVAHRPESASQVREIVNTSFPEFQPLVPRPSSVSSAPFSATEELIWDWQAVALALAVFACLLFFVVACAYSVHHARQWRRLKDNFIDFEADVGELSTRLSLLLPAIHPDEAGGAIQTENSSQCVYLEQLLARKRNSEEGAENGNVYIDRDVPNVHRG